MNLYVVMGVSGSGKTTIARALAENTGGVWLDADEFHPPENKRKMAAGIPLTDDDRWEWLDTLRLELKNRTDAKGPVFLACSALRESYRQHLANGLPGLQFIYLKGSPECIAARLASRTGHFMSPALLKSQFETLEEPTCAITADIDQTTESLVAELSRKMSARTA
jgi:gluconokinase